MNKILPFAISALIVGSLAFIKPCNQNQVGISEKGQSQKKGGHEAREEKKGKIPLRDRMDLAWKHEIRMTADPATGTVPRERLVEAKKYADYLRGQSSDAAIPGTDWTERGPSNVSGRTRALLVDPNDGTGNTVFAGSVGGGLWKTTNVNAASPNWAPVDDLFGNLAISSIAVDPSNSMVMYFSTGEGYFNLDAIRGLGVWKSTNGGTTWAQLASTNNANFYFCQKIAVTSTGVVLVATSTGLRRSTDGGTTFTKVLGTGLGITGATSNFCYDVEIAANGDVYSSLDGSVHKSVNGGATFAGAMTMPAAFFRCELACAPSDANYVYAVAENSSVITGIWRTTNAGTSWAARTEPDDADPGIPNTDFSRGQAWYDISVAVDPNNRDRMFVGGVDLFVTADGAATWTQVAHWYGGFGFQYVHADQHLVYFQPGSSSVAYFTNDGGVYRTTNANAGSPTITFCSDNYNVTQFYACAIHPTAFSDYFLAGAQDNGSQQYNTAGIDATVEVTGGDGAFCHIDQDQPQFQWTSYVYNDFYRSNNGGATWTGFGTGGGSFISPTDYDNVNNRMYCCNGNNNYIRWDNPQTGGTFVSVGLAGLGGQVSAVTVSPNTANRVFFGGDTGGIIRADNAHTGAPTLTVITGGTMPGAYLSNIEVETGNDNHLLVVFANYGTNSVWESVNGGTSWTSVEGNLPDMPIRWALFNPNNSDQAMVATELGVWTTDNLNGGATNWAPSNTGLANVRVDMLQMRTSDKLVIAATHGRGLYSSDVFTTPNANFVADKLVNYTTKNIQFTDVSYNASSWSYDFGDGSPLSTAQNPVHAYAAPGRYNVTLTINGGVSTLTRNSYIHILPDRPTTYAPTDGGNFEVNIDDFDQVTTSGTAFVRGVSAVAGKNGTQSPTNVWVTGIAGNYVDNGSSWLYCPSFSFSTAGTYTLRFFGRSNCENQFDGYNVEYSLDKGDNWTVLGTAGAGWYNFANGGGGTAFPTGVPFFTGNLGAAWVQYSRDVSFLAGNPSVAFRFAFKTDGGVTGPGVAIDNFEIIAPVAPLPVADEPLTGKWRESDVELTWRTLKEEETRGFYLDRSFDGVNFENVSFVQALGMSETGKSYTYIDRNPGNGLIWYRYRLETFDGQITFSNTVLMVKPTTSADITFKVFPSPFTDQFQLYFSERVEGALELQIINGEGRMVFRHSDLNFSGENFRFSEGANELPSGIYFVQVRLNGKWQVQKILKL